MEPLDTISELQIFFGLLFTMGGMILVFCSIYHLLMQKWKVFFALYLNAILIAYLGTSLLKAEGDKNHPIHYHGDYGHYNEECEDGEIR